MLTEFGARNCALPNCVRPISDPEPEMTISSLGSVRHHCQAPLLCGQFPVHQEAQRQLGAVPGNARWCESELGPGLCQGQLNPGFAGIISCCGTNQDLTISTTVRAEIITELILQGMGPITFRDFFRKRNRHININFLLLSRSG